MLETLQEDVSRELSWEERDEGERGERGEGDGEGERTMSARRKESYRKSQTVESRQQLEGCLFSNTLMTTHKYDIYYSTIRCSP